MDPKLETQAKLKFIAQHEALLKLFVFAGFKHFVQFQL